jgi:hypothetical protein
MTLQRQKGLDALFWTQRDYIALIHQAGIIVEHEVGEVANDAPIWAA